MTNFEIKNDSLPTVDSVSDKLKNGYEGYSSVNIERTSSFCKETFNKPENKQEVCSSVEVHFVEGLKKKGINFKEILKTKVA